MVSQKDTTFTKIFVGGLPYHTTDETLRKFFERFGDIEEAVVITDRATGKSRGYGFVTMATKEAAQDAIKDPNPVIDGRKANVNLAYLGAKPRTGLNNPAAANSIIHLGAAYPTIPTYGLQPIMYPTHTLLGSSGLIPFTGAGTTLSPTNGAQAHYTTAYDLSQFGATAAQLDLQNAASASFPYSSNAINTVNALNLALNNQLVAAAAASNNQLAASNASQQLANANSYYAALANAQAISAGGAPSLAAAYQQ